MHTYYENTEIEFRIDKRDVVHKGPHVIDAVELVLVTEGAYAAGVGTSLFAASEGDLVVVFPDLIRHAQVFGGKTTGIYLTASPDIVPAFQKRMATQAPENPVIDKNNVHADIGYAMRALLQEGKSASAPLVQGYLEVILTRASDALTFTDKDAFISNDIIDRVVSYIAKNFQEPVSLTKMAADLYVSPYTVSRIFSSTFHTNFNGYLNHARVEYAARLLALDDVNVTEAWTEAGFESQRTFNRVFQETYHMAPSEFKKQARASENV